MQIRKQLRALAMTFGREAEYAACCWARRCPDGYHGAHARIRFKARSQHHGNATGQSKHAGK